MPATRRLPLLLACVWLACSCGEEPALAREDHVFGSARSRQMEHLDATLQQQVRDSSRAWRGIMLHCTDGDGEDFSSLERHHAQVLGLPGGLAWHFVIGDGKAVPAGKIHVGPRWAGQEDGEAMTRAREAGEIHICLLGEADQRGSPAQLAALDELLTLLLARFGSLPIRGHDQLEEPGRPCPGDRLGDHHWVQLYRTWPRSVILPEGIDPEESDGR